jgi:hypothetical protein
MGIIKAFGLIIIAMAIALPITIYFHLNPVWSGINGFFWGFIAIWIDKKIRQRRNRINWETHFRNNR